MASFNNYEVQFERLPISIGQEPKLMNFRLEKPNVAEKTTSSPKLPIMEGQLLKAVRIPESAPKEIDRRSTLKSE